MAAPRCRRARLRPRPSRQPRDHHGELAPVARSPCRHGRGRSTPSRRRVLAGALRRASRRRLRADARRPPTAPAESMTMRNWLIITTVDVLARPNNREHNMLACLAERFESVHVVFRRQPVRRGLGGAARDALLPSISRTRRGNITFVAVNPLGNNYEGLRREATGLARGTAGPVAVPGTMSSLLHRALAPLGMVKDVSTIL